ncbi:hypothetical protein GCM10010495_80260 [Kitasatospora herbaricolor]|nr:hypothetical protein GCM10010495_80260 [Kitasatospora herbaricolor]
MICSSTARALLAPCAAAGAEVVRQGEEGLADLVGVEDVVLEAAGGAKHAGGAAGCDGAWVGAVGALVQEPADSRPETRLRVPAQSAQAAT